MSTLQETFKSFLDNQREVLIALIVTVTLWLSIEYESIGNPNKDEILNSTLSFMELCTSWNSFCAPQTAPKDVLDCFNPEIYLYSTKTLFDAHTANGTFWTTVCETIATEINSKSPISTKYKEAVGCQLEGGEIICAIIVFFEALFLCSVFVFNLGLTPGLILSLIQSCIYGGIFAYFWRYSECSDYLRFWLAGTLLLFSFICFLCFIIKKSEETKNQNESVRKEEWDESSFPKKFKKALDKQKELLNIIILTVVVWLVMNQLDFVNPKKDELQLLETKSMVWAYQWNSQCFETKQVNTFYYPIPERLLKNKLSYNQSSDCLDLQLKFNEGVYKNYTEANKCKNENFMHYGPSLITSQILVLMSIYTIPIKSFKLWFFFLWLEVICLIFLLLAMSQSFDQGLRCNHLPSFFLPFGLVTGLVVNIIDLLRDVVLGKWKNQSTSEEERANRSEHHQESTSNVEIEMDKK